MIGLPIELKAENKVESEKLKVAREEKLALVSALTSPNELGRGDRCRDDALSFEVGGNP